MSTAHRVVVVQMRMALACLALAVLGGALGALHYVPALSPEVHAAGLSLPKLRALHTTFASLWIYGGAIAVIYHFLAGHGRGLTRGDVRRFWLHTACWLLAGVGALASLLAGVFSGREYLDLHPVLSVPLLAGWLLFAWTFLKRALPGFWGQPIYVWFWTVGILYFVYTFVEGHAYLLPWVEERPLRDLALHWKSCGTLVGSFNFLVYGALAYVSERLSGDKRYGQSTLAFALFGVGCLNSFTNYAHHTYHLPQSHAIKWIAFVVSMAEAAIWLKLLLDVVKMLQAKRGSGAHDPVLGYLGSARVWTMLMLAISIVISVPSWNSVIHGTHVVTGHAMGTELGIDTMVLFGGMAFLLAELYAAVPAARQRLRSGGRAHLMLLNAAMAALVTWLSVSGLAHGLARYRGEPSPEWVALGRFVFPMAGGVLALTLLHLVARWGALLGRVPAAQATPVLEPVAAERV